MKFSLPSFLLGVAAAAVVFVAKNKGLLQAVDPLGKQAKQGDGATAGTPLADTGKRAVSVIADIA